jgi:hypothetical protein
MNNFDDFIFDQIRSVGILYSILCSGLFVWLFSSAKDAIELSGGRPDLFYGH